MEPGKKRKSEGNLLSIRAWEAPLSVALALSAVTYYARVFLHTANFSTVAPSDDRRSEDVPDRASANAMITSY